MAKQIAIDEEAHKIVEKESTKRRKIRIAGQTRTKGGIASEYIIQYYNCIRDKKIVQQ